MEPKHLITQLVGFTAMGLLVRWGVKQMRRDWRERRLPLVPGPYGGGTLLVVLGALVVPVPIFYAIFSWKLIPMGSPALFVATLGWFAIAFVFGLMGALAWRARRKASGWLTILGDETIRVEADGETATLRLRPGSARLRCVEGTNPQFVQVDLHDGTHAAHFWGMLGAFDLKLVRARTQVPAQGLMVAVSMGRLCRWLAPFLTNE